ncbi:MAG TPA: hypothetical protein VLL50_07470, partial [Usitatibacter sp.]|nr:hypothetical protein [Usitatibacter sp.]
ATASRAKFDIAASLTRLVRDQGWTLRENPVKRPLIRSRLIYFQRPGCEEASVIVPFDWSDASITYLADTIRPDFDRSYIYLDARSKQEDRVAMIAEWARHRILGALGASHYVNVRTAILLAEPADCRAPATVDWRAVWDEATWPS